MSLESDLYALLASDASISAAVNAEPCIYLGAIPKGQPDSPAIVIQVTRTDRLTAADGPNRLTMKQVQFDSYHQRYTECLSISNAIFNLVKTLSGSLASTQIQGAIAQRDMDLAEEPGDSGYVFRRLLEFHIWHTDLQAGDLANTFTPSAVPAPGSNATYLEGIAISPNAPTDGQVLVYNAASGQWIPGNAGSASTLSRHSFNEAPDGVRTVFTLSSAPNASALLIDVAGMIQGPAQYSLNGSSVTFNFAPQPADEMFAWF